MWLLHLCTVICCCLAAANGQILTVTSLPAALFTGGSRTVVEGSVILLYCEVDSTATNLTVTWNKDSVPLVQDVPHIVMRTSTSGSSTTSLLLVDNFLMSDGGTYQCTVQDETNTATGDMLTLTGSTAVAGSLEFRDVSTGSNFLFRGRIQSMIGQPATIQYEVGHVDDSSTDYSTPQVQWLKDGLPASNTPTNTDVTNGRRTSTLSFSVMASDAGVYQCIFTDTSTSEIFATVPTRLDTGNTLTLEAVSPSTVILSPPEKLVLEVTATGGYSLIQWSRNGNPAGINTAFPVTNDNFAHFGDIYVNDTTTMDDLGVYEADLTALGGQVPPDEVDFVVITPDGANTTVTSTAMVTVGEGDSVDISCSSIGIPVPTVTWTLRNQATPFSQDDVTTDVDVTMSRNSMGVLVVDVVTSGSVVSTLHIVNAQYPAHDGVYQCTGANSHTGRNFTQSATITVQVQVPLVVDVVADRLKVGVGDTVTLTCNVTSGNPMTYTYTWTHVNGTETLTENSDTLTLTASMDNVGTYRCEVANGVGTGMDSITIELGVVPGGVSASLSPPGPVVLGTTVDLVCEATTGDDPISYTWTDSGDVDVSLTDTDGTISVSFSASEDYGTYTCTANNAFGMDTATVEVVQAVVPSVDLATNQVASPVVLAGEELTLSVSISDFNIPLNTISWLQGGTTLTDGDGRVTITNDVTLPAMSGTVMSTLNLSTVIPADTDTYNVIATNDAGNTTVTFTVTVEDPVSLTAPLTDMAVVEEEGGMVTFTCTARGVPEPSFTWTPPSGDRISVSTGSAMTDSDGFISITSTLTISSLQRADTGSYTCTASNTAMLANMMATRTFTLTVNFAPSITVPPVSPVLLLSPSPLSLNCTADGLPLPTITWIRTLSDGSQTEFTMTSTVVEGRSFDISTTSTSMTTVESVFTIDSTVVSDTANYSCRASNSISDINSTFSSVSVFAAPTISIPADSEQFRTNEGTNVTFCCAASGLPAPSLSFLRGNETLTSSDRIQIGAGKTSALASGLSEATLVFTLFNAVDSDSGYFSCVAVTNISGIGSFSEIVTFNLTILVGPSITTPPMDQDVVSSDNTTFTCVAEGLPRPTITWIFLSTAGPQAVPSDTFNIEIMNGPGDRVVTSTLTLTNIQPIMGGTYMCNATNEVDTDVAMADLNVQTLPEVVLPPEGFVIEVDQFEQATFTCAATGFPVPDISWLREINGDNILLEAGDGVVIDDPIIRPDFVLSDDRGVVMGVNRSLTLNRALDEDSGRYFCVANSTIGEARREFQLVVRVAANITELPSNQTVTAPNAASLTCSASGVPRPNITWVGPDLATLVSGEDEVVITNVDQGDRERTSTLTITRTSPSDRGQYTCLADNGVTGFGDTNEAVALLTIYVSPMVTSVYPDPSQMNYTVNMGDVVTFQCVATGIPAPSITWFRDGVELSVMNSQITSSDPSERSATNNMGEMILEITRTLNLSMTEDSDSGSYECRASNDATPGEDTESFELIVQIPPATPVITESTNVTVTQPEAAMFVCTAMARPRPSITWYKVEQNGSRTMLTGTEEGVSITAMDGDTDRTRMSTLLFNTSRPSFSAVYVCVASNPVATAETNATLRVYVSPMVTSVYPDPSQTNYTVNMGDVVTFQCVATGIPAPSITWLRNGTELSSMDPRITFDDPSRPSSVMDEAREIVYETCRNLTLGMTEDGDSGSYECRANNDATPGEDTESFELIVQIPPATPVITEEVEVTVTQPEAAMFVCTATARPRPSIRWYKVEQDNSRTMLTETEGISITTMDGDTDRIRISTLLFDPSRPSFSAVYVCVASNPVDTAETNATLSVYVSPNVTSVYPDPSQMNYTVNMGDVVTFQCVATGIPAPSITWFRNGMELNGTDPRVTFNDPSGSSVMNEAGEMIHLQTTRNLTLSMTEDGDSGSYECRASNDATPGEYEETFELIVQIPPAIPVIAEPSIVTVTQPEAAMFVCTAMARPRPSITWYKVEQNNSRTVLTGTEEGVSITAMDGDTDRTRMSTLLFDPSRPSFSAVYVCVASNPVDTAETNATVNVYVSPMVTSVYPDPSQTDYTVNMGDVVTFQCVATGIPAPFITWFRNGTELSATTDPRITFGNPSDSSSIMDDAGETILEISRMLTLNLTEDGDSGSYECRASNNATLGEGTQSFELIVQIPPATPVINGILPLTVTQPEAAMFVCTAMARPRPSITWYRVEQDNSRIMLTGTEEDVSIIAMDGDTDRIRISTLLFDPSRPSFSSSYVCEASNPVDSAETSALLIVLVFPDITTFVPDGGRYVFNITDTVTFQCSATGFPAPAIQWFRGGQLLNSSTDSRVSLSDHQFTSPVMGLSTSERTLTITNILANDTATDYSCNATNSGMDSEIFELFVQVPPEVVPLSPNQRLTTNVSESATLRFRIDNAAPPVLTSDIRWYYTGSAPSGEPDFISSDFQEITNLTNRTSKSTLTYSENRLTLDINNIVQSLSGGEETDAGRYFMRASNPAGEGNSFIDVIVFGPPQIVGGPANQFVVNGSSAVFACNAIADPQHEVSWSFTNADGVTSEKIIATDGVDSGSKYVINRLRNETTFGQLTVNDVIFDDRGVYTCTAENSVGFEESAANLTVHVPPVIGTVSRPGATLLTQPVAIFCLATGYPIPTFTWQLNGVSVPDSVRVNIFTFSPQLENGTFESSGFLAGSGGGEISDLLAMNTDIEVDMITSLGELGTVSVLSINGVVREDTGDYTCTASNQLPRTTVLTTASTVPLVVLERPDPPTNVTAVNIGPFSVELRWTLTFNGNRLVLSFMIYISNVNTSGNFTLVANISVSQTMRIGSSFMYNITGEQVQPFTQYTLRVVSCNEIGCSDESPESPVTQTQQYTSSPPRNVMVTAATSDTLSLQWQQPSTPNGIIFAYMVSFTGSKDYDRTFSQNGVFTRNLSALQSDGETVSGVVDGLVPGTTYVVTVQAINGAVRNDGVGDVSQPAVIGVTDTVPPPQPPPPPSVDPPLAAIDDEARTVIIPLPQFSTLNGPISHYQVVVVILPLSQTQGDLRDPDSQFSSLADLESYTPTFCDRELTTPVAYITAEFGANLFPDSMIFVVGGAEGDNAPNDRPNSYTNGLLCYNGRYVFFVRAYPLLDSQDNAKRSVRQADAPRQYTQFTSSNYYAPTTIASAPVPVAGIAAGIVIGLVVVVLVVAIVIVVVVVIVRRRSDSFKPETYYENDYHENGDSAIILTQYAPPDEGTDTRQPIPLRALGPHVERMHLNENCGFGEEYRIIQEKAPKKPVDICTTPENKPRNRYANIQCFDETRVTLEPIEGAEHDYINANFVNGYNRKHEYIAAQGPLPDTIGDFWRMIWDYDSPTVVMLTNLLEKMKVKCSQYWPNSGSSQYSNFSVTLVNTITHADFVIRHFHLKSLTSGETKEVRQYHFISWPDFGVPRHATPLLYFLRRIRNIHKYSDSRPLVIHCSAGVGRTGSLITIDLEIQRAEKEKCVDPFNSVMQLRQQRNHMVQTEAQYVFVHDAILEAASSGNTEVSVEKLSEHMKELEHVDEEQESGYSKEFQLLRQFKVNIREFTDANDDANKFKNRLANALPYNYNRVHLQMSPGVGGSDYINASYIDGYSKKATYIATQGPLKNTVEDFWRMIWEREVNVVVMLTQLEEKGKEQSTQYWPSAESSPEKVGKLTIELLSEASYEDYLVRELKVTDVPTGKTNTVKQFHFLAWPENGAPLSGVGMVDLIDQVTRTQQHTGNKPIVVHCSAGIGRTGAFCSLSTAIERVKAEGVVDVFHTIKHLRTQRPHMVQNVDQYIFCYRAIREYVESLNNYSNFQ